MAKRKITIELSDETIAVIERLKVDELSLEEVIPKFIDAGIVDAITSGESTNPLARLMDRIMSSFAGSNKGKVDDDLAPSTTIKMMRINENGEPEEVNISELPAEISGRISQMEETVKEGLKNGKSINEIMAGMGAVYCNNLEEVVERATRHKTEIVSDGNVIHFPTTKLS